MKSEKLQFPIAVLSDVYANLEALEAVLADIKTQNAKSILCMGDSSLYGPNPAECLDLLRDTVNVYLLGRTETFILEMIYKDLPAPPNHKHYYEWPIESFKKTPEPRKNRPKRTEWLSSRPDGFGYKNILFTPSVPETLGTALIKEPELLKHFELFGKQMGSADVLVVGGDHFQWYAALNRFKVTRVTKSQQVKISENKPLVVGVGSVGQPRDKNPQTGYVILTEDEIFWRRLSYDVNKTSAKAEANPKVSFLTAKRLQVGM